MGVGVGLTVLAMASGQYVLGGANALVVLSLIVILFATLARKG